MTSTSAKAKALLAEAGYPNGFTIEASVSERSDYKTNMLMVQDMLRKIGINVQLKIVDHASYHASDPQGRRHDRRCSRRRSRRRRRP